MNFFLKTFLPFFLLAVLSSFSFGADTLEVYAIRVQFERENPDNSLTTGDGTFNSDDEETEAYSLDPPLARGSSEYWQKHFEFVRSYFEAASNGQLVVKARMFPESSTAYKLKKQIIDYNRTRKLDGEKTEAFDEARSRDYLQFIYDAVMAAHESGEDPFSIPQPEGDHTKRAYMIIHAGASRLVDGGSMGTNGADTQGDFMDVFIDRDTWMYLPDTLEGAAFSADSVVNGLVLDGASIDTLRSIMVVSETASQDGLNWGINGIMVNQIARSLGLPNTYDVVQGISRLGYYDVMDFAGYSAGNGFFPSMPAAWDRTYMGWSTPYEVHPVAGKKISVDVAAAGSKACEKSKGKNPCTEVLKVPLSASEYLLIENRERSWNEDGTIDVILDGQSDDDSISVKTVDVDKMDLVFEDSVCTNGKCEPNKKKASGVILGVSSFDAGLPASGVVVWRVNEWYLRETLEYGYANVWAGDTFRDHQYGLALIEADGILSIGKTFQNALGEDTYDYGSGTDLLPHLRVPNSSSSSTFDTVKTIEPTGYANTMTAQGGYTGIRISVSVPEDGRKEKSSNAFMGDSVLNFVAQIMTVTVSIDDGSLEDSKYPRNVGLTSAVRGAVFVEDSENDGAKALVIGAEDGTLQMFTALGDTLFEADTAVIQKNLTKSGDEVEVPLFRLGESDGPLVGLASDGHDAYSLHKKALVRTHFLGGMVPEKQTLKLSNALVGPVIYDDKIWTVTKTALKTASLDKSENFVWNKDSLVFSKEFEGTDLEGFKPVDMAICGTGENAKVVIAGEHGQWMVRSAEDASQKVTAVNGSAPESRFRIACTDLDRDGNDDVVFVGSRGSVFTGTLTADGVDSTSLWNLKTYKRGASGTSGLSDETSGVAVGDVNGDNYPEIVFLGDNLVYALDRYGLPLKGFPATISSGSPICGFFSDPLIVDVTGDDTPEILVPSNDGLIYAFTGKGTQVRNNFPIAAGSFGYVDSLTEEELDPMSIFVTDAVPSKKSEGPELYALHRTSVSAFRLNRAESDAAASNLAWTLPAGGNERTGWFDASALDSVETAKAEDKITEFFMFPNPVRGGHAKVQFEIANDAKSATLELFDVTGLCVFKKSTSDVVRGRNRIENVDLSKMGSDVYTARLRVKFSDGKTKQKLYRIGVIR